jgi:protein TonB
LEAASLSAIEAALSGEGGGGGDFAEALSFASGGRIGGMGKAGAPDENLKSAFSLSEIDQKPRPIFQAAPVFPAKLLGKKVEGVVNVLFIVDATGKVSSPRVEKSTHPAFEKPAVDAVKQWKFEPAVRGGKRVACKVRAPIRFQPSEGS